MLDKTRHLFLFTAPAVIITALFLGLPLSFLLLGSIRESSAGRTGLTLDNLARAAMPPHSSALLLGFVISLFVLLICVVVGTSFGFVLSRLNGVLKGFAMIILLVPILTSEIVIAFGWLILLGRNGLLNNMLLSLGLIDAPLSILYTPGAVALGLAALFLPFIALPVASAYSNIDPNLYRAAASLGAGRIDISLKVVFPLIRPALYSGCAVVYALSMSAYALPQVLGGGRVKTSPVDIYNQYLVSYNPGMGAALAILLLIVVLVPLILLTKGAGGLTAQLAKATKGA